MDFSDFTKRISKGFEQVKQFTAEKIGTADEITSYPPEYRLLEEKCEKIKIIYDQLISVNRQFVAADVYEPPYQEQVVDVMEKINEKLNLHANLSNSQLADNRLKTIQHAAAKVALDGSVHISPPDEFTQALSTYGVVQEKLGHFRVEMDQRIQAKFIRPMQHIVETYFSQVASSRKAAQGARFHLDAIKTKCKTARDERLDRLQRELIEAEEQFAVHVEDAITQMKAASDSPIVMQCLADLVDAQRQYHKQSYDVLSTAP